MSLDQSSADPAGATVYPVEFPAAGGPQLSATRAPLKRFYDVSMTVSVELGRAAMPIGELLHLSEGAVIQLDRVVSQPVDIIAQGVRLARGEVVVVDERYAVRITEIESADAQPRSDSPEMVIKK
ncbi:flagellar motor switch protein FliN [Planctomicrobium piriforme]|uniref:Flagellar motor switch protein FliN n=1 Tax=Planctomicrobium piriforme TaxID=1576369 RepID=A0A1I3HLW7_9PLAN|nr:flagellar motor switch protein FliN [Planctomicrobium piriforme]SFI36671.1 flagellar motor switch protein FliN/FliY [Planctomicrobium piriforme]